VPEIRPRMNVETKKPQCPRCGVIHETHETLARTDPRYPGIIDVGWRCINCSHEWGFEVLIGERVIP